MLAHPALKTSNASKIFLAKTTYVGVSTLHMNGIMSVDNADSMVIQSLVLIIKFAKEEAIIFTNVLSAFQILTAYGEQMVTNYAIVLQINALIHAMAYMVVMSSLPFLNVDAPPHIIAGYLLEMDIKLRGTAKKHGTTLIAEILHGTKRENILLKIQGHVAITSPLK